MFLFRVRVHVGFQPLVRFRCCFWWRFSVRVGFWFGLGLGSWFGFGLVFGSVMLGFMNTMFMLWLVSLLGLCIH